MKVALIATLKNEAEDLPKFLRSIQAQTRRPDGIVFTVSSSSTDKTHSVLRFGKKFLGAILWKRTRWFWTDGNRAAGRNEAIDAATMLFQPDIIACTNVCELNQYWLETLVVPIERDGYEVSGGRYFVEGKTFREEAMALLTQYSLFQIAQKMNAGTFYPSALSLAFTPEAWASVGGFPENFDTSEDTLFVHRLLLRLGRKIGYTSATVVWRPSSLTILSAVKMYHEFARTDEEAGLFEKQYGATLLAYVLIFAAIGMNLPLGAGMLAAWLLLRVRKVVGAWLFEYVPYTMLAAFLIDMARIAGFWTKRTAKALRL